MTRLSSLSLAETPLDSVVNILKKYPDTPLYGIYDIATKGVYLFPCLNKDLS